MLKQMVHIITTVIQKIKRNLHYAITDIRSLYRVRCIVQGKIMLRNMRLDDITAVRFMFYSGLWRGFRR
jgi:hypothetical protein